MRNSHDSKYYKKIWEVSNKLRGQMPINDFHDVFLGLLFYRIISEQVKELNSFYFIKFNGEIDIQNDLSCELIKLQQEKIGFSIRSEILYDEILKCCYKDEYYTIDRLREALNEISSQFQDSRYRIFEFVISNIEKLDNSIYKCNKILCELLHLIDKAFIEILQNYESNFGRIFNTFIDIICYIDRRNLNSSCSPSIFSELLAELITSVKSDINSIYNPVFGYGGLTLNLIKGKENVDIFGYEINPQVYNIARMNLIINNYRDFKLILGNSLDVSRDNIEKYDVVIGHPPFNLKWDNNQWLYNENYRYLPPKSSANYAFILSMLEKLNLNGVMAIVLPHGVLFRENNIEKAIRKDLIENNLLDAVIGIPRNLMYGTNIPLCILIFRKNRLDNKVFFIDISSDFKEANMKISLSSEDIKKIKNTYINKFVKQGYSEVVSIDDIKNLDYNVSIHKYIDIFRTDMLMKNYNFKKYKLEEISEINVYKGYEDENYLILRANNPKVIDNYKEFIGNNSNYISIFPDKEYLSVDYMKYFFYTHISKVLFESISVGNTKRISINELKGLEIPLWKGNTYLDSFFKVM